MTQPRFSDAYKARPYKRSTMVARRRHPLNCSSGISSDTYRQQRHAFRDSISAVGKRKFRGNKVCRIQPPIVPILERPVAACLTIVHYGGNMLKLDHLAALIAVAAVVALSLWPLGEHGNGNHDDTNGNASFQSNDHGNTH